MKIKIVKTKVNTFRIDAKCECGGIFERYKEPDGAMIIDTLLYPLQYTHICDKCGRMDTFAEIYPNIIYEIPEPVKNNSTDSNILQPKKLIEKHNHGITLDDLMKVRKAIEYISKISIEEHGGFVENNILYKYVDLLNTEEECVNALHILAEFVKEFSCR